MSFRTGLFALLALVAIPFTYAAPIVGPWVPIFKGVDYSVSTNSPGTEFPHLQVVTAFRVDLHDPDVRLLTTPRRTDYIAGVREVGGLTVSDFLATNHLQAAINANFFDEGFYYRPAGWPMDIYGLSISEGVVVSPQDGPAHAAALLFTTNNAASIVYTNWPAVDTTGIYTAVAGNYPLVIKGKSVAPRSGRLETDPRTAFGLSQDRRYLYLIGIDGRQPGYSTGAYDYETAGWLLLLGAYDGVNMDGGGSTTLVMASSTGDPVPLNHSNAVADSGNERTIGSHLGVYAKPLPGFINDLRVLPEDRTATISWTTLQPATAQVEYGTTPDLGTNSPPATGSDTNYTVLLGGLTPKTQYYFRVSAITSDATNVSPMFTFSTTNYVQTNLLFEITNEWKYSSFVEDSTGWTKADYDDSGWNGPGPGLLWVDVRSSGPNELVDPKNTMMDADPISGYPYVTYYFRTYFSLEEIVTGAELALSAYVDDGLIVYLNGQEIWRLRVSEGAGPDTVASAYGCDGDATCAEDYLVPASASGGLKAGDNVLAVEVHNYSKNSPDITFGLSASLIEPIARSASISIESSGSIRLSWEAAGYHLQSSASATEGWVDEIFSSPATITPAGERRFYRLSR